jgi:hypothetical protein
MAKITRYPGESIFDYTKRLREAGKVTKSATGAYNPQTGVGTFDDGTQYEKFTWEPDKTDPTKLYRENAGTGQRIGEDYIAAPVQPTQTNSFDDMLSEMLRMQQELAEARASEIEPFEHPDLIKDNESDNEVFI